MTTFASPPPFVAVIPARLASTRLPGKPLADIGGKPMVVRVAEQARASGAQQTIIASDAQSVLDAARAHGFEALMTRADHPSGTDRLAEVAAHFEWPDDTIIVNVQGDEPLIDPTLIKGVATHLEAAPGCAIATAAHPLADVAEIFNPNVVKVVLDKYSVALYFSRAPIPWVRDVYPVLPSSENPPVLAVGKVFRHIGLYAYRARFLKTYPNLEQAPIEQDEALEQLRAMWHGERIAVLVTRHMPAPGVDTSEDLERARAFFQQKAQQHMA